jgi:N-acetylglucosamine-6-phosphate deacetylase
MQRQLGGIACRRLFTPTIILDNVLVLFEGAKIGPMGEFTSAWLAPDIYNARADDVVVTPGLIDVHVHGCGGADFLDKTAESMRTISAVAARGGATSVVATTTIPVDDEQLEGFAEFLHQLRQTPVEGARFLGIHLEGPFINPERRGGFGERYVQRADLRKAERILSMCESDLLKITLAPEIEGGADLVYLFAEHPRAVVEVSIGHSSIGYDDARRWFRHERVRQVTHAFNAMCPFHHRDPGLVGAALLDNSVLCEMIPDGCHLTGPAIELLYRLKGPRRLMLVTDGTAATGTPPGTRIRSVGGDTEVRDGAVRLPDGSLAGSNLFMAGALAHAQQLGNIPFDEALLMATLTPARSVNKECRVGSIDPGKAADFCVLRRDGSVKATIRDGLLVHED